MCRRLCTLVIAAVMLGSILASVASAGDPTFLGWWKFDDGAGTVAKDSSGNGYHGTIVDAAWEAGNLGGALKFSGAEYVDIPIEACSTVDMQLTVAFWTFIDSTASQWPFTFGAFTDPANNEARAFQAHLPWDGPRVYFDTGGTTAGGYDRIDKALTEAEYANAWVHWAFVKDAETGDQQVFRNGELWHSGTGMTRPLGGADVTKFTIGCKPSLENYYTGTLDDFRLYNRALTAEDLVDVMLGKGPGVGLAAAPSPANEATDVPRDMPLAWEASENAATHDVYLGTVFDDVNDASRADDKGVLLSQGQTAVTNDPEGVFEYGQTYYWRIDEVNGAPDNTIFKGETWSFTVEPLAYAIADVTVTSNIESAPGTSPENLINGSGLNENDEHSTEASDMWQIAPAGEVATLEFAFDGVHKLHEMLVWNYNVQFELMLGFGVKDVTIEYSENGADWATLGDVTLNQATANAAYAANTTVDLGGVAAQYVKITINSGHGMLGQFGLSEVRFLSVPVQAREPQPEDGATDVAADADASWRSGREAVSSEVYLSTDPDALELIDTVSTTSADLGALDLGVTYHWMIAEVNEAEAISTWDGPVWSFSTEAYMVVEDFESYVDDEGGRIYEAWVDGYGVNGNGSQVGHLDSPFAEQTIVKSGQSMPLFYDNTGTSISEAERTLDVPMDWTVHGIKSLSLAFAGDADNDAAQLYIKVNGTKVVYGGAASDLQISGWLAWTIDIADLGNVSNVTTVTIGVEGAGAAGVLYVDDIRLYPQEGEMIEPIALDATGLVAHYTLDANFQDSSGNGNHATPVGDAVIINDPAQGAVASFDGLGDAVQIPPLAGGTAAEATIALWVNTDIAWTTDYFSLFHGDGWAAGDIHMHITTPDGNFNAGVNGLDGGNLVATPVVVANEWYQVTVSLSASEASLYVNGVQEASRVPTTMPETLVFGEGHLGAWLNGAALERMLTGQVDDVRFYNRALSYGEVMTLAGRTTPLYKAF